MEVFDHLFAANRCIDLNIMLLETSTVLASSWSNKSLLQSSVGIASFQMSAHYSCYHGSSS
jgi:hypothetical protein